MADEVTAVVPKKALHEVPIEGSHGLDLNSDRSEQLLHMKSSDILDSQREYKKLFFDCNLHLVLPKLLRFSTPDANGTPDFRDSTSFEVQGGTRYEFTDAEVARLLRRHLHILVASQRVPDSEVVAAAKVLQQQYRPLEESSVLERETEKKEITAVHTSEHGETGATPTLHDSCDVANLPVGTFELAADGSLGGFCMEASQASDELVDDRRRANFPACFDHQPDAVEKTVTELRPSQRRGPHEQGTSRHAMLALACTGSESAIYRHRFTLPGAVDELEQPTKKVCVQKHSGG